LTLAWLSSAKLNCISWPNWVIIGSAPFFLLFMLSVCFIFFLKNMPHPLHFQQTTSFYGLGLFQQMRENIAQVDFSKLEFTD